VSTLDIQAWAALIDKGGVVIVLVAIITALTVAVRWMFGIVIDNFVGAIAYRELLIQQLQGQVSRQQDLFDQAMKLLNATAGGGRSRRTP
jgi:hypothetical protein